MKKLLVLFCMVVMLAACGGGDGGGSSGGMTDAEIRGIPFPDSESFILDCTFQGVENNSAIDVSYYVCDASADFATYAAELDVAGFDEVKPADANEGLFLKDNIYQWEYECDSGLCDVYWIIIH